MGKTQHAETPWFSDSCTFGKDDWKKLYNDKFTIVTGGAQDDVLFPRDVIALVWGEDDAEEKATADFIVRACNSHYDLLQAVKQAYRMIGNHGLREVSMHSGSKGGQCLAALESAIAKAEGK